jgi:hypothetical protein
MEIATVPVMIASAAVVVIMISVPMMSVPVVMFAATIVMFFVMFAAPFVMLAAPFVMFAAPFVMFAAPSVAPSAAPSMPASRFDVLSGSDVGGSCDASWTSDISRCVFGGHGKAQSAENEVRNGIVKVDLEKAYPRLRRAKKKVFVKCIFADIFFVVMILKNVGVNV